MGYQNSISIGPSAQYYHFNEEDNKDRFILNTSQLNSYDSATLEKDKVHAGIVLNFVHDTRDNDLFATYGSYINIRWQSLAGLNKYSKSFTQIIPSISVYRSLNYKRTIILADRLGGGVTFGQTTFYQSLFLDGKNNLMGYRQNRFAGQYSVYNNFELRIKLADFTGYILPGQFGFIGLFDIGRVWETDEHSNKWHNGTGGGFYFSPAGRAVLKAIASYSSEGWYPYVSFGFRF
jgi:outer membrane protein assembly factor BamA